jgi:hypothetical protein
MRATPASEVATKFSDLWELSPQHAGSHFLHIDQIIASSRSATRRI